MKYLYNHYHNAFTLIELLVTVSVSAILVSLAVASYSNYREHAYDTVALSQARDLYTSLIAGQIDNNYLQVTVFFRSDGYLADNGASYIRNNFFNVPIGQLAPGFVHILGVRAYGENTGSNGLLTTNAGHCKGSKNSNTSPKGNEGVVEVKTFQISSEGKDSQSYEFVDCF